MKKPLPPEAVDCHLHAGLERRETLDEILDYLVEDGRKVAGLVDHAELYLETPPDWAAAGLEAMELRVREVGAKGLFEERLGGPSTFYREAREASERLRLRSGGRLRTAVGLEVSGPYLDRTPQEWLEGADYLGICTPQPPRRARWGDYIAELVEKAEKLRGGRDIGLVLHHPFRWRLLEIGRSGPARIDHAGGFTAGDARVVARALARAGAVAEVNFASFWHLGHGEGLVPAAREAFGLLREAGVRFSLGSDFHGVRGLPVSYEPERALEAFGVGAGDVRFPKPFDDVRVSRGP